MDMGRIFGSGANTGGQPAGNRPRNAANQDPFSARPIQPNMGIPPGMGMTPQPPPAYPGAPMMPPPGFPAQAPPRGPSDLDAANTLASINRQPRRKKAACPQCHREFADKGSVRKHIRSVHQKLRPHGCEVCGLKFAEKSNLRKHVKAKHTNIREHVCPDCGKAFTFNDGLLRHTRLVHQQIRRFQCTLCGNRFKQKTHLQKHLTSHENKRKKQKQSTSTSGAIGPNRMQMGYPGNAPPPAGPFGYAPRPDAHPPGYSGPGGFPQQGFTPQPFNQPGYPPQSFHPPQGFPPQGGMFPPPGSGGGNIFNGGFPPNQRR